MPVPGAMSGEPIVYGGLAGLRGWKGLASRDTSEMRCGMWVIRRATATGSQRRHALRRLARPGN